MFVEGHTRSEVGQFSTADMGQFYSVANIILVMMNLRGKSYLISPYL